MSFKKQIFKLNDLRKFLTEENSCVSLMPTVRLFALPPFFLNDMKSGILYLLNNMLKKYDRSLGGIVMGYQNIKILMDENTGIIPIGTSETEVNVSVEFYIFQPRIGSSLEGVVNKKSNNHVGCLVHRYFNATILKPDDIDYEDWICKNFNVDDRIIFKVKDLDFTSFLPYIEGVIGNKTLLNKKKYNVQKNCDTDNLMVNNLDNRSQKEILCNEDFLRNEVILDEKSADNVRKNKKIKNKNKEVSTLDDCESKHLERTDSFTNLKKKKKKKDKEEKKLSFDLNYLNKDKYFNDEEVTSSTTIFNKADESQLVEKKKKKKKSDDNDRDCQEGSAVENVKLNPNDINHTVLEKLVPVGVENSNDFVKPFKKRKEKKKKGEEEEPQIFNKISQCLSSNKMEDNVLYSTLLDPVQSEKMRISFCSPIPPGTPFGSKKGEISLTNDVDSTVQINNQNESYTKEKKKKQKKRKREEKESEGFPIPKKIKTSHSIISEKETEKGEMVDNGDKLEVQTGLEQLYNQQVNKIEETINMSNKVRYKEEKKNNKKAKKREKENIQNKVIDLNKNSEAQLNGAGCVAKKSEESTKLETQLVEELNTSEQYSFKGNKRTNVKVNKKTEIFVEKFGENSFKVNKISKDQKNCVNEKVKKSEVQNILDEQPKQEINKVKNNLQSFGADSVKERKEITTVINKQETLSERSHFSLYEKLLKQAKSAIDLNNDKQPMLPVKKLKNNKSIKDSDLSDFSSSSSKKKNSGKKNRKSNKKKTEVCHQTPDKYKNGSMYNASTTPKNINPDKSLFSDSEQSHAGPIKKMEEANGTEVKLKKSSVQILLEEFYEEERKRLQSESDKESLMNSSKTLEKKESKSEQKPQNPSEERGSLYKKLLKEARSLIDFKKQSSPKKKKK